MEYLRKCIDDMEKSVLPLNARLAVYQPIHPIAADQFKFIAADQPSQPVVSQLDQALRTSCFAAIRDEVVKHGGPPVITLYDVMVASFNHHATVMESISLH